MLKDLLKCLRVLELTAEKLTGRSARLDGADTQDQFHLSKKEHLVECFRTWNNSWRAVNFPFRLPKYLNDVGSCQGSGSSGYKEHPS